MLFFVSLLLLVLFTLFSCLFMVGPFCLLFFLFVSCLLLFVNCICFNCSLFFPAHLLFVSCLLIVCPITSIMEERGPKETMLQYKNHFRSNSAIDTCTIVSLFFLRISQCSNCSMYGQRTSEKRQQCKMEKIATSNHKALYVFVCSCMYHVAK